jgi:hypothetical protein
MLIRSQQGMSRMAMAQPVPRRCSGAKVGVGPVQVLSFRTDGLLFQCLVKAVMFFAPQDIVFLGIALMAGTYSFFEFHTKYHDQAA